MNEIVCDYVITNLCKHTLELVENDTAFVATEWDWSDASATPVSVLLLNNKEIILLTFPTYGMTICLNH